MHSVAFEYVIDFNDKADPVINCTKCESDFLSTKMKYGSSSSWDYRYHIDIHSEPVLAVGLPYIQDYLFFIYTCLYVWECVWWTLIKTSRSSRYRYGVGFSINYVVVVVVVVVTATVVEVVLVVVVTESIYSNWILCIFTCMSACIVNGTEKY